MLVVLGIKQVGPQGTGDDLRKDDTEQERRHRQPLQTDQQPDMKNDRNTRIEALAGAQDKGSEAHSVEKDGKVAQSIVSGCLATI